jgi:hypothetical protein
VRDLRDRLEVEHRAGRVADRLAEEDLRLRPRRVAPGAAVVAVDERELDGELAEQVLELGDRPPVERLGGDDVVARLQEREEDAPAPPSRLATRSSSAAVVGLTMRV